MLLCILYPSERIFSGYTALYKFFKIIIITPQLERLSHCESCFFHGDAKQIVNVNGLCARPYRREILHGASMFSLGIGI